MMTTATLAAELRAELADFAVLAMYDEARFLRYGDMARSRRGRELSRRRDALEAHGLERTTEADWDLAGRAVEELLTGSEVVAAYDRTIMPRRRRFEREPGAVFRTPHARATRAAYDAVARRINGLVR